MDTKKENVLTSRVSLLSLVVITMLFTSSCGLFNRDRGPRQERASEFMNPVLGDREFVRYDQIAPPGMVFIEGGTFVMGRTEQDVMYDWNNTPRRVTVSSFWMDETEVTNEDYLKYLDWLNDVFGASNPQKYRNALPDTLVWREPLAYNEPYVENYLRHPAYHNYPVVGVSWVQATEYARWRTDRVNETILVQAGILEVDPPDQQGANHFRTQAYLQGQYEGIPGPGNDGRRIRWEDGLLLPRYRLPLEAEWEYAALGLIGSTVEEQIQDRRLYPWESRHLRSDQRRDRGRFMANFQRGPGDLSGIAGYPNPGSDITMPVGSFAPNDYGLYDMAGNVSEWVKDVYRPLSFELVSDFRPFRGNVFMEPVRDEAGNIQFDPDDGSIIMQPIDEEDNINRRNYRQANYIDYRDGDPGSAIADGQEVYPAGSTLINNQARVYKGGSWRDRAYWLSPGNRRFLDENQATNDIGFRCAMELVGPRPR